MLSRRTIEREMVLPALKGGDIVITVQHCDSNISEYLCTVNERKRASGLAPVKGSSFSIS